MIKLFELGENSMVQLNKEWISMIPEFKRLLTKDKGGPGDGSGKYKKHATRQFTYIFLRYDFRSPLENYNDEEREIESMRMAELTPGQVQADGDLWDAIRMYQQLLDKCSPTLKTYRDLKDSVDDLTEYIKEMNLRERTAMGAKVHSPKDKQEAINGMPKTMETLTKLELAVKQEMNEDGGMRGDAVKGGDEDPDY